MCTKYYCFYFVLFFSIYQLGSCSIRKNEIYSILNMNFNCLVHYIPYLSNCF